MSHFSLIEWFGFISSIILPFSNIPLMMRLYQRKSSADLSLIWLFGIFFSLVGMLPVGLRSEDFIFRIFTILNLIFFSGVTFLAVYYRLRKKS